MQLYYFYQPRETANVMVSLQPLPDCRLLFRWLDCRREDVLQDSEAWQAQLEQLDQLQLNEYHLRDILNLDHPCSYDSMHDYDLLIFRKLISPDDEISQNNGLMPENSSLYGLSTTPISFILRPQLLVSVREQGNYAVESYIERLKRVLAHEAPQQNKPRKLPSSPIDLCLRFLNSMVDGYLDLRAPLSRRVEFWQMELLQGRRRFSKWQQLFQENLAFQHIENLCEEQIEILQELRDEVMEHDHHLLGDRGTAHQSLLLVRVNDVVSHIERIQKHTLRLRGAIQSAIDLHFSAIANQTNENMRILAIITAIFAPLTLLTGVYGMNFEFIPGLKSHVGFWMMLCVMLMTTIALLYYFYRQHLLGRGEKSVMDLLGDRQRRSLDLLWFLDDVPLKQGLQDGLKQVEKLTRFK